MFSIGELSQIAQVTVKTLRYYHDLGLLEPAEVDPVTNYRYYNSESYERLNSINSLKDLGFTLSEIKTIFSNCSTEEELKEYIGNKIIELRNKAKKIRDMEGRLKRFNKEIDREYTFNSEIVEFYFAIPYLGEIKVNGSYGDVGNGFSTIYRSAGRYTKGSPYSFFYDMEYKEENPNFSAVVELSRKIKSERFETKSFKKSRAVKVLYKGDYGGQGKAYIKLFNYCKKKGYKVKLPIIEHYIKGPGLIFKGNPNNYLTECIFLIEE